MLRCPVLAGLVLLALGSVTEAQQPAASTQAQPAQPAKTTSATTTTTATTAVTKKKTATKHHKAGHTKKTEPVVQAPPPPPPTPEESPAGTPQVTFQNGQLSIKSDNSTLSSILTAIKTSTGASVDGPGATATERVATQIGPGDPRDVLTTLLNSTKYDFILLGAPGNPKSVQKIILTARASGPANATGANMNRGPARPMQAFSAPPAEQPDPDQSLPDAEIPDEGNQPEEPPQPEPPQPEPAQQQQQAAPGIQTPPGMSPAVPPPETTDEQQQQQQQQQNQPKSPEQLLQELQRMQQQQQQQRQNQEEPH